MRQKTLDTDKPARKPSVHLSKAELLSNLRDFKQELGKTPTTTEMKKEGPNCPSTYCRRFGGWNDALREAGIEPINHSRGSRVDTKSYSKEEVINYLRQYSEEISGTPTKRDYDKNGPTSVGPVKRHFDSWNDAIKTAGLKPNCPGAGNGRTASNNPRWEGGSPKYYGPSWESQRIRCLERDGRVCQRCGISTQRSKERYGQDLHVHHIEPFRKFESHEAANELSNLISLCQGCHNALEGVPIDNR